MSTYESNAVTGSYLEMTVIGLGWQGTLWNETNKHEDGEVYEDKNIELVDKTTLKVSKQTLVDKGFADGKYEFVLIYYDGKEHKNNLLNVIRCKSLLVLNINQINKKH